MEKLPGMMTVAYVMGHVVPCFSCDLEMNPISAVKEPQSPLTLSFLSSSSNPAEH